MNAHIEACPDCMMRSLEMLSTIFKVQIAELVEAVNEPRPQKG